MHSPNPPEPARFRPHVERLEDRTVPAGNVTASVVGGTLFIDGDDQANVVTVAGTGWQSVAVRPGDATTTINGLPAGQGQFIGGITRGIVIRTGDGDDTVRLEKVQNRRYIGVFAGAGNDTVVFDRVKARGGVQVLAGAGDDAVTVVNSDLRRGIAVELGDGDDTVQVAASKVRRANTFSGGAGDDTLAANGNQFKKSLRYIGFETFRNGPLDTTPSPPTPPVPPVPPVTGAPTATVTSSSTESTADAQIPFQVAFDQNVTGFDANDLGVTNGSVTNFTAVSGSSYAFSVVPAADGSVTVNVPANVGTNAAGQGNTAAAPVSVRSIRTADGLTGTAPNANDPNFEPTGSGLAVWEVQTGSGKAVTASNTVRVFYTGFLTDGTIFDQSRTTGQPATFPLSNLISGFREGLIGMQPGGIRRFRIPPELGYGAQGSGSIPPNATLLFEVKLVSVT